MDAGRRQESSESETKDFITAYQAPWVSCTHLFPLTHKSYGGDVKWSRWICAEAILGLYKCNYSLTVKDLKLHLALWRQEEADVAPGGNDFDTPAQRAGYYSPALGIINTSRLAPLYPLEIGSQDCCHLWLTRVIYDSQDSRRIQPQELPSSRALASRFGTWAKRTKLPSQLRNFNESFLLIRY